MLIIGIFCICMQFLVDSDPTLKYILRSLGVFLGSMAVLTTMFIPRLLYSFEVIEADPNRTADITTAIQHNILSKSSKKTSAAMAPIKEGASKSKTDSTIVARV